MEPGVLFDGGKVVYAAQTQNLFAAYFFQHFLLAVSIAYGFTQGFQILVDESVGYLTISFVGKCHFGYQCIINVLAEQCPTFFFVFAGNEACEYIVFTLIFLFLAVVDIATHQ